MRDIKFRAWDGESMLDEMMCNQDLEIDLNVGVFSVRSPYRPGKFELLQFTGLRDKNGKEIFEGDIVKGKAYEFNGCPRIIGKVIYDYCEFKVDSVRDKTSKLKAELNTTYEVIGNIYENPELLEQTT